MATSTLSQVRTIFAPPTGELNSWTYRATVTKPDGSPLTPSEPGLTLTLTLYDIASNTIVNAIDHVNILNADRGVLTGSGLLTINFQSADNPILNATASFERRVALLEFKWTPGGRAEHEVEFTVKNLSRVP